MTRLCSTTVKGRRIEGSATTVDTSPSTLLSIYFLSGFQVLPDNMGVGTRIQAVPPSVNLLAIVKAKASQRLYSLRPSLIGGAEKMTSAFPLKSSAFSGSLRRRMPPFKLRASNKICERAQSRGLISVPSMMQPGAERARSPLPAKGIKTRVSGFAEITPLTIFRSD